MKSEKYLRFYFASVLILVAMAIGLVLTDVVSTPAKAMPPKQLLIQKYSFYDRFERDCNKRLAAGWKVNHLAATSTSGGYVGYIIVIYEK